jgi:hypothetical protein
MSGANLQIVVNHVLAVNKSFAEKACQLKPRWHGARR